VCESDGISTFSAGTDYRVTGVVRAGLTLKEGTLNKSELIDSVAKSTGESKRKVSDTIEATLSTIQKQVKSGNKVTIPGFGTFERRARSARTARNPRTGEPIKVKASKVPAFKAGAGFKSFVSGK
jgi:DNA-binding protein HU-beta